MFGIWFRKGFIEINTKRTAQNLSEVFSGLGGLLGIFLPVCAFLVGPYASTAFNNAILKKLYKYQAKPKQGKAQCYEEDPSPSAREMLDKDPFMNRLLHKLLW
mmetsp:Transcript_26957/g.20168  ORF Transcript_26957/g.20168 Transcript_26957/m.20168 type:complete len:103 (+) Transcript_26957:152-460(+)